MLVMASCWKSYWKSTWSCFLRKMSDTKTDHKLCTRHTRECSEGGRWKTKLDLTPSSLLYCYGSLGEKRKVKARQGSESSHYSSLEVRTTCIEHGKGHPLGSRGSQHLWPPLTWRLPHLINCRINPRWKLSAESDSNYTQTSATNRRANTLWQSSQAISHSRMISRTYLRLHSDQSDDVWWNYFRDLGFILWIKASVLGWHQKSLSGSWCSHAADLKREICPWHLTLAKAKAILLRAWIK